MYQLHVVFQFNPTLPLQQRYYRFLSVLVLLVLSMLLLLLVLVLKVVLVVWCFAWFCCRVTSILLFFTLTLFLLVL